MDPVRPEFVPDPSLSRAEMEALQRDIAAAAVFEDALPFDVASLRTESDQRTLGDDPGEDTDEVPLVAGVDQAFVGDRAVSAVVVLRDGAVVEEVTAVAPAAIPYIPGLLSFREGGAILAAFEQLDHEPDVVLVDGSGRIHFREAGLATHIGVTLDVPTVGVAKNLLCGRPRTSLDRKALGRRAGGHRGRRRRRDGRRGDGHRLRRPDPPVRLAQPPHQPARREPGPPGERGDGGRPRPGDGHRLQVARADPPGRQRGRRGTGPRRDG